MAESDQRAKVEGLGNRVHFEHRNAFNTNLREATVVTMWLFPNDAAAAANHPGTRAPRHTVLTTTWNLGSWKPDQASTDEPTVYMWIVPARVAGNWEWTLVVNGRPFRYASVLEQRFQETEGVVQRG